ncbi:MerR family transcriptional regulator [Clostridium merdae]|uniref:MerR family transcriptional regulator n=1 Tax=Clostridium merdae TaxID=1958780 RepID=UPI000A271EC9|nr:MerR family transcriptional regulator [Clostridium merdae]
MLKIGDFSRLSRISIRMLRHYDEIGLLMPQSIDSSTGYRYYNEAQLVTANRIQALKEMGFGLSVIAEIMKTYQDSAAFVQYLLLKKAEILEEEKKVSRQLLLLDSAIKRLGKDENAMEYTVVCKELPERYVASLRKVIPAYDKEGILWELLGKELAAQKVQQTNDRNALAIFHDKEHMDANPDVEIQISVKGTYQSTEQVVFKTVPAMEFASATFQGGYEQIREVNQEVANWIRDNGYDFAGPMFSIYHVSPSESQNPDEWITEMCFPIHKK